ncbi:hypothetical protein PABG_11821 [Paracoccidioides brasiliensis Pb03]|nr:hypothetical protein PABG_11821 [Paracoccidioides brasiliensis Pb03]ODH51938.1 hypothetical protein GX48_01951 [Paracoccidioides brasiliensis]
MSHTSLKWAGVTIAIAVPAVAIVTTTPARIAFVHMVIDEIGGRKNLGAVPAVLALSGTLAALAGVDAGNGQQKAGNKKPDRIYYEPAALSGRHGYDGTRADGVVGGVDWVASFPKCIATGLFRHLDADRYALEQNDEADRVSYY